MFFNGESEGHDGEHVPEEVQETVVEEGRSKQAPNLVLTSDIVGELGLKSMQSADPPLMVTI